MMDEQTKIKREEALSHGGLSIKLRPHDFVQISVGERVLKLFYVDKLKGQGVHLLFNGDKEFFKIMRTPFVGGEKEDDKDKPSGK